jgi:hypothetical protein
VKVDITVKNQSKNENSNANGGAGFVRAAVFVNDLLVWLLSYSDTDASGAVARLTALRQEGNWNSNQFTERIMQMN